MVTYTKALEEIFCLSINIQSSALSLREIEGRNFRDVLILSLSLFFLELEGDTTDGTPLNALHQMSCVTSNLSIQLKSDGELQNPAQMFIPCCGAASMQ
jgi:hypothetical protein